MRVDTVPVDARIKVAVVFETNGTIVPVWFDANGQRVKVQEVCYRWTHMEGSATVLNFAIWDGKNTWELAYNVKKGSWMLKIQSLAP